MPASKDEVATLRKNLAQAKQKTMNFAFCPGKKGDDCLLVDQRKPTEALVREARKISTGTKTAGGTLTVTGSTINLVTESDLPNVSRTLKKYLKSISISMKVQLVDAQGAVLEADDDEEEYSVAPDTPAQTAEQAPDTQEAEAPDRRVQAALGKRLKQAVSDSAAVDPETRTRLRGEIQRIAQMIQSGDLRDAAGSLVALESEIQAAPGSQPGTEPSPDDMTDPVAQPSLAPARESWKNARAAVRNDLKALVSAVAAATASIPQLRGAARQTADLNRHFASLDGRLEALLARLEKSPEGPERDKLAKAVLSLVNTHRKTLNDPFFAAVDNNGFADTRIRQTLVDSLDQVAAVVST